MPLPEIATATEEQRLLALPECLQARVNLPNRPIQERMKKRSRTQAQRYQDTNHFQPRLEDLQAGECCIILAPDKSLGDVFETDQEDQFSFRLQLDGRGNYSRLVYLVVVERVDRSAQQVTWLYVGPRKMTDKKERKMGKQVAKDPRNWILVQDSKQTADWDPDEMIINWVKDSQEKGWCVPGEQYDDIKKVLIAMQELSNVEEP